MKKRYLAGKKSILTIFGTILGIVLIIVSGCNLGTPENSRVSQAKRGKVHYDKYCIKCHGEDAKGVVVDSLQTKPADLTLICQSRRTTQFPILEIANLIDGRKMAGQHGTREMPIWGDVFEKQEYLSENEIKGKMAEIIAYLMSIQKI